MLRRRPSYSLAMLAALVAIGCGSSDGPGASAQEPSAEVEATASDVPASVVETVAEDLAVPWEIAFLPGGDLLVTERSGDLVRLSQGREASYAVVERMQVPDVAAVGEGGLMGVALHPDYPSVPELFLCHTTRAGGELANRVVRFRYEAGTLAERTLLVDDIPGATIHDGCRLTFDGDGHLLVTTGDAGEGRTAQERESLGGKVLRITTDGDPAPGNPFDTRIWSLGHRNPQGLAFDDEGRLWATEHGPSGLRSGRDELNRIEPGENYGWPELTGDAYSPGTVRPVAHSGSDTWAPAGLAFAEDRLFFAGLRGSALYEARLPTAGGDAARDPGAAFRGELEIVAHFRGDFGRLRAVRRGPDGGIWFTTSNRDGRGRVREGDDRILRVDPAALRD